MKRLILGIIFLCSMLAVVTVSYAIHELSPAESQPVEDTLAQQIQGTWILVSIINEQDGKKFDVFGPNPRGVLILTPDGRFVNIIMRASLPRIAANNRVKGTAEENRAILEGTVATFGTYKVVSDKEYNVIWHVEGSTFPNWDGQDQKRIYTVIGDELKVINPTPSIGSGKNYQVYKRAK